MKQAQILMKTLGFFVIMRLSNAKYLLVEVDNIVGGGVGQEGIIRNPYFGIIRLFKWPESIVLVLVLYTESASMCVSAFVPELWQFYLSYCVLGMMSFCKYSLTMSMISKVRKRNMIIIRVISHRDGENLFVPL